MIFKKSFFVEVILLVLISTPFISYASSENSQPSKNESHFKNPTKDEREKVVNAIVSHFDKVICQNFVKNIVELTDQYSINQITELMVAIINGTEEKGLSKSNCLENLREIVSEIGTVQMQQQKLDQLEEIVSKTRHELEWLTDEDFVLSPPLSAEERCKIIKEVLCVHHKTASEQMVQLIVEENAYCNESSLRNWVTKLAIESNLDSIDEDRYVENPTPEERLFAVKEVLSLADVVAPKNLLADIVALTDQYSIPMVTKLAKKMVKRSKSNSLDEKSCIEVLKQAIDLLDDEEETKKLKLAQIEEITLKYASQSDTNPEVVGTNQNKKKHPLLDDIFHPDKSIFIETAKQLKSGKFRDGFLRGILLYGPPGVGKNEMIRAIVNESGCRIFSTTASELVNKYQGSGAGGIKEIFDQARAVEPTKGVIILIDELQSAAPLTTNKNVPLAHTRSGQDFDNVFTQLWVEFDRCVNDNNNIMIMATCNQFDRIDERIRGRFNCVKFSYPDKKGTYEILKKKSSYLGISLSESELQEYTEKMKNLNGRELDKFIKNASQKVLAGKSKSEALALTARELSIAKSNARSKDEQEKGWLRTIWDGSVKTSKWVAKVALESAIRSYFGRAFDGPKESSSSSESAFDDSPSNDLSASLRRNQAFFEESLKRVNENRQKNK